MSKTYKPTDEVPLSDYSVGVIVGRFQVPELHEAHKALFDTVTKNHKKCICVLGLNSMRTTVEDPLDFKHREIMIRESYPNLIILCARNNRCDDAWSRQLDSLISDHLMPNQRALLYGSRDSFISHYTGRFDTAVLESKVMVSGTAIRRGITDDVYSSADMRAGIIWGINNTWPRPSIAVDIAIQKGNEILLCRKAGEEGLRFVGGFASGKTPLEEDAQREAMEETGARTTYPLYITSGMIDDWRTRGKRDGILSTLFLAQYVGGTIKADDDVAYVVWVELQDFVYPKGEAPFGVQYDLHNIVPEHRHFMEMLLDHLKVPAPETVKD